MARSLAEELRSMGSGGGARLCSLARGQVELMPAVGGQSVVRRVGGEVDEWFTGGWCRSLPLVLTIVGV